MQQKSVFFLQSYTAFLIVFHSTCVHANSYISVQSNHWNLDALVETRLFIEDIEGTLICIAMNAFFGQTLVARIITWLTPRILQSKGERKHGAMAFSVTHLSNLKTWAQSTPLDNKPITFPARAPVFSQMARGCLLNWQISVFFHWWDLTGLVSCLSSLPGLRCLKAKVPRSHPSKTSQQKGIVRGMVYNAS